MRELRERLRDAAVAAGLQEVITYPLTTPETLLTRVQPPEMLEVHPPLRLENPMSSEQSVMRTSLRAASCRPSRPTCGTSAAPVALFESAHALPHGAGRPAGRARADRRRRRRRATGRWGEPTDEPVDFFDAKGMLEEMLRARRRRVEFRAEDEYGLLRGRTAAL